MSLIEEAAARYEGVLEPLQVCREVRSPIGCGVENVATFAEAQALHTCGLTFGGFAGEFSDRVALAEGAADMSVRSLLRARRAA